MALTENFIFWILIYALEFTALGLIIISNQMNLNIKKLGYSLLFGILFGVLVIGIIIYAVTINDTNLMYF